MAANEYRKHFPIPSGGLMWPAPTIVGVSFETGEVAAQRVYFPAKVKIERVRGVVTKAIAATDNGTVTVADAAGDTITTLTATASDALAVRYDSAVITDADATIEKDSYITITPAKTTAGGRVNLSIEYSLQR